MTKKNIFIFIKVSFTLFALYFVFSKIDIKRLFLILQEVNFYYLFLAFLIFNLSKILSSIRLNFYFRYLKIDLRELEALRLYYVGMFYNLFLPGGIGGDGYKIYLLKKRFEVKTSSLISVTLLDRISGLVPLLFLAGILFEFSPFSSYIIDYLVICCLILVFPFFYIFYRLFFNAYISLFFKSSFFGILVQVLQLFSALVILLSLGIDTNFSLLLTLFLISSVVAVIPITIGGVGSREMTFLYGLSFLGLNSEKGIAFSLLFFIITAISSFIGAFFNGNR